MKKTDFEATLNKARNLCSKSEKCADDLYKKNKTWQIPPSKMEKLIAVLKEENFIDHERFAHAFVNDKLKLNHWGRKKIEYALKAKSIETIIIHRALEEINEKEYDRILEEELLKKLKRLNDSDPNILKQKLIQYLVQKGFEYGKVFDFVDNKLNED